MASRSPATPPAALGPGFRFHPSDEELVQYYLKRKASGKAIAFDAIAEVDIYKKEPWNLGGESKLKSRDMEWYFFSALDRKYGNGGRVNRATSHGYWKATGNDRSVLHGSKVVGMKKTLVFHSGRAPAGQRTNWIMHEYRLVDDELVKALRDSYVVCRVFLKSDIGPPHKDRYAPFIEEEWDDDKMDSSQEIKSLDEAVVDSRASIEESGLEQDTQSTTLTQSEFLKNSGSVLSLSPSEGLEDYPSTCPVSKESSMLFPSKRSRHDDPSPQHSNSSGSSLTTECTITKRGSPPSIFGFPLVEFDGKKECQIKKEVSTAPFGTCVELNGKKESQIKKKISTDPSSATVLELNGMQESEVKKEVSTSSLALMSIIGEDNVTLPPSYLKYITYLEDKVREISAERERLKADMMRAQSILNVYKSGDGVTLNNNNSKKGNED